MRILPSWFLFGLAIAGCSGHEGSGLFVPSPGSAGPYEGPAGSGGASSSSSGGASSSSSSGSSGTTTPPACTSVDATDQDGDGVSGRDGDCNECDPSINPGAFDVPGNGKDDDCSGSADDEIACDATLDLASTDAFDGAKALGLCRKSTDAANAWGVISARYVKPDGQALPGHAEGFGILPTFGNVAPLAGGRVLALSSGAARAPNQAGFVDPAGHDKGYASALPNGYTPRPPCPGVVLGLPFDGVALEVKVRVPTNARSFSFNENLFSYDFPTYVCGAYNDVFVVLESPRPAGLTDANIVFDSSRTPLSADSADLLQACSPQAAAGKSFACAHGVASLAATGFETHAATDWLVTRSPVVAGTTITLLFAVWDSADGVLDTTVLLDGFTWSTTPVQAASTAPK
jgi:Putative metal-binding motif